MNLVYDLFVSPDENFDPDAGKAQDRSGFRNLAKMTPAQREQWDAAFEPKNEKFRAREANRQGPDSLEVSTLREGTTSGASRESTRVWDD